MRILITGACSPTPRAVIRSLRMSPHFRDATLIGTDRGGNWFGFYEGLCERLYRVPGARDHGYEDFMCDLCREEAIDAAIVTPEVEVLFWSGREFPAATVLPSAAFVELAVSKRKLYDALRESGLVPAYGIVSRPDLLARRGLDLDGEPVWLRDYSDATSSGAGAIKVSELEQAYAWACLNPEIESYMVAEHLPGRNLACCLLFVDDELRKVGCYERVEYFGGRLVLSGVTGNICFGRLLNDAPARRAGEEAIRAIARQLGEPAHGLFTVDLRETKDGEPKVTEINVRHTAATSALAAGGANLVEAQLLAAFGRFEEIGEVAPAFADDNAILRDIDGEPIWLSDYHEPAVGEYVGRSRG